MDIVPAFSWIALSSILKSYLIWTIKVYGPPYLKDNLGTWELILSEVGDHWKILNSVHFKVIWGWFGPLGFAQ